MPFFLGSPNKVQVTYIHKEIERIQWAYLRVEGTNDGYKLSNLEDSKALSSLELGFCIYTQIKKIYTYLQSLQKLTDILCSC
jgi:hypothetical protein